MLLPITKLFNATVTDASNAGTVYFMFNSNTTAFNATATNVSGNWNTNVNVTNLVEGLHTVTIFANDTSNNINQTVTLQLHVDRTVPTVTLLNTSFTTSDSTPLVTFNYTDYSSTANCTLYLNTLRNGSTTASNYTNTDLTASALVDGAYTTLVGCTDGSGNSANSSAITITLDTVTKAAVVFSNR